jgi:S1-C subfamily serine protease
MGQFDIPGFLPEWRTNKTEQASLNDKLQSDAQPIGVLREGFERIPTQLPGDRWDPNDVTAYRANSGTVAQYRQAKESVVFVESTSNLPPAPGAEKKSPSVGSGFVATPDGRVVTGYHVVKDAKPESLVVTLSNGKKYQAEIEHLDPKTELAVLRLHRQPYETFKPLAMAQNSDLQPGERVSALGYPRGVKELFLSVGGRWQQPSAYESPAQFAQNKMFLAADGSGFLPGGFKGKVTLASMLYTPDGKERIQGGLLPGEDPNRTVISTDLKVEPGNSGGPLLNQNFEAIGVIAMTDLKGSKAGSTPIEDVRKVLADARVFDKPNVPVTRASFLDQTNRFPFLRPEATKSPGLSNHWEYNANTPANTTNLQFRLRERLAPYR